MTSNERPTPETDAVWDDKSQNILEHARRLERERDEAREELDELNTRLIEVSSLGVDLLIQREEFRREFEAERALADRLAGVMFGCTGRDMNDAYDAWKEARK